jgi:hypothetical protein
MNDQNSKRSFSNHRQWREFIAAVHETLSVSVPVNDSRASEESRWETSANWLRARGAVAIRERETPGMGVDVAVSLA